MSIFLPDYNHCTVNLACSVLEEFGAKRPRHKTLDAADRLLQTKYHKNIVLLVLDAMGQSVLEDHLAPDGFFRQHLITVYSSIFPSTTAAATTSLDSALCPSEHGWLGWNCYFSEIDRTVTVLLNRDAATGESITDYHVARTYCPYKTIHERIRETGAAAYFSMPYIAPYPPTFPKVCERVQELCALDGHKYIYAYWDEPDNTMHTTGCDSKCSRDVLSTLEQETMKMCQKLAGTNTILFITADHGHINSKNLVLTDYPDLMDCLLRPPFIEARATSFLVKPDSKQKFERIFNENFSDAFRLMTKSEVIASGLFGPALNGSRLEKMLGDYLSISVGEFSLYANREKAKRNIGTHAGLTAKEMQIPLIGIEL